MKAALKKVVGTSSINLALFVTRWISVSFERLKYFVTNFAWLINR
jgi:hypothetical protein